MEESNVLVVGIGDIKIGKAPDKITTYLGSCIAVCLYSPLHKVGGMLHLMLASARLGADESMESIKKAKYADTGIPEILKQLKRSYNLETEDFKAKIFGGAKVLRTVTQEIGQDNEDAARSILKGLGIKIIAAQTGGEKGYKVEFDLNTGKVSSRIFGQEPKEH